MSDTTLRIETLPEKWPWEIVAYVLSVGKIVPSTDVIGSVAFRIYLSTDDPASPTDLASTMQYATDFDATLFQVECDVQSGTADLSYILEARIQCNSGNRYIAKGKFKVRDI